MKLEATEIARLRIANLTMAGLLTTGADALEAIVTNRYADEATRIAVVHLWRRDLGRVFEAALAPQEVTHVARADASSPLRAEGAPSEGARVG
jgi:hypothetical protein